MVLQLHVLVSRGHCGCSTSTNNRRITDTETRRITNAFCGPVSGTESHVVCPANERPAVLRGSYPFHGTTFSSLVAVYIALNIIHTILLLVAKRYNVVLCLSTRKSTERRIGLSRFMNANGHGTRRKDLVLILRTSFCDTGTCFIVSYHTSEQTENKGSGMVTCGPTVRIFRNSMSRITMHVVWK